MSSPDFVQANSFGSLSHSLIQSSRISAAPSHQETRGWHRIEPEPTSFSRSAVHLERQIIGLGPGSRHRVDSVSPMRPCHPGFCTPRPHYVTENGSADGGGPRADMYRLWNGSCAADHDLCLRGRGTCSDAKHFGSCLLPLPLRLLDRLHLAPCHQHRHRP
jgi:hypothetical protein